MPHITLKPGYKAVRDYYTAINKHTQQLSLIHEGNVAPHFANLLRYCAGTVGWTLAEQYPIPRKGRHPIQADGALLDDFKLRHGVWEAKDSDDDLPREVKAKFAAGYPQDNILFQSPARAILVQDGRTVFEGAIAEPDNLVEVLRLFFAYEPPAFEQWHRAVDEFKEQVPQLAQSLLDLIREERTRNRAFVDTFDAFMALVREAINPNISVQAVEEMLIQHLLTERIFRTVFNNPDFAQRNVIAREIEKVIAALTSRHFSRHDFLRRLDRFYGALESTAATIDDYSEKQSFLNTVYEKFFQGFSVKVADTHGIVYTPQPIVEFMVRSVDDILRREFGKADGLASDGVAILDPFVGTGNFILRVMRQMPRTRLPHKYKEELFCNEVMLLPYYIASMNIEHEYYELTGRYEPFEGISLVDTFELAESRQLPLFVKENTRRVQRQKDAPIFVVIGNPPYNAGQVNENDNNKNRKYPVIDDRVSQTYARDSKATLLRKLSDPYVKAFRWATDRIGEQGVVAFVTNNSFVHKHSFDGMRNHLGQDYSAIYILDLGGDVRENPKLSGTTHNVFGIQVGVSINFLVRRGDGSPEDAPVTYYARTGESWRKEDKYSFLDEKAELRNIEWRQLSPDDKYTWLTRNLKPEFDDFVPLGTKQAKRNYTRQAETIFRTYALGVSTNRDAVVYDYNAEKLATRVQNFSQTYNAEVYRYIHSNHPKDVDDFVKYADIKWSRNLKRHLRNGDTLDFNPANIRESVYRPFTKQFIYLSDVAVDEPGSNLSFFPSGAENQVICVPSKGGRTNAWCFCSGSIPNLALTSLDAAQCFPFYTYDEDGSNRQENITDWALDKFRARYGDAVTKWDIFHYVYALLHHPTYRETYAANLRRELPRIPFVREFWPYVEAGRRLAEIHVHYEAQPQYPLRHEENPDLPLDYRIEKMRLSRDKTSLKYNDFLTLHGIPPQVYDYRLGNRSALEWVVDQYRVKTDSRSGITNDPNNPADQTYILRLLKQVITVSLETVEIVNALPELQIIADEP